MKPILLLIVLSLSSCVQSTVTRVREDGAKEVIVTKGLSDPARGIGLAVGGRLLDAYLPARSSK